jgi:transcription-repair coupling factor (superfamily II helicase)
VERLNLYKDLDEIENEEKLNQFESQLRDRFGSIPKQVNELSNTIRLRWKAKQLGIEKLILKTNHLKVYLVSNPDSHLYKSEIFTQIINYVKTHPAQCKLREDKDKLSIAFTNIKSIKEANNVLEKITQTVEAVQQ